MSGRGIAALTFPERRHRVDLWPAARRCGFETLTDSQKEDRLRARRLRGAAKKYPHVIDADAAQALAASLTALAHNLRQAINLVGVQGLIQAVKA